MLRILIILSSINLHSYTLQLNSIMVGSLPAYLGRQWSKEEVDEKNQRIMKHIFDQCYKYGKSGDDINLAKGANIAGFIRVADALIDQGIF